MPRLLEKVSAPRAVKEIQKALGAGNHAYASQVGKGMQSLGNAPRFVKNISSGGQEAAVDLMAGAPMAGHAASGLFARKLYKPDSMISRGVDTTNLLHQKQNITNKVRSLGPEARAAMPAMYGSRELHPGTDTLRHLSDHEYVPGLTPLNKSNAVGAVAPLESTVHAPLAAHGLHMGDVPRLEGGGVVGNASNVMLDAAGKPKIMDFLPHNKTFEGPMPVALTGSGHGVYSPYEGTGSSYGAGQQQALRREVFRPTTAHPTAGLTAAGEVSQGASTLVLPRRPQPAPLSKVGAVSWQAMTGFLGGLARTTAQAYLRRS